MNIEQIENKKPEALKVKLQNLYQRIDDGHKDVDKNLVDAIEMELERRADKFWDKWYMRLAQNIVSGLIGGALGGLIIHGIVK